MYKLFFSFSLSTLQHSSDQGADYGSKLGVAEEVGYRLRDLIAHLGMLFDIFRGGGTECGYVGTMPMGVDRHAPSHFSHPPERG